MKRGLSTSACHWAAKRNRKAPVRYNYNPNWFETPKEDTSGYPLLDIPKLQACRRPPVKSRVLSRDFIADSLYNPHYGYFSRQATIFDPDSPSLAALNKTGGFDFPNIASSKAFDAQVAKRYSEFEGPQAAEALPGTAESSARQIWHTPTELFKPWYARAVARYMLSQIKEDKLEIYEVGAGNGTLMDGILSYLKEEAPAVYANARYNIIEISPRLAKLQRAKASAHGDRCQVHNADVFNWKTTVDRPCFVLAFEVLDNLAHDVVRYIKDPTKPAELVQCFVCTTSSGDFMEEYTSVTDPLILDFLSVHEKTGRAPIVPQHSQWLRTLLSALPFSANLSDPIFIPTKAFELLRTVKTYFPQGKLVISDFSSLPDTIPGQTAPVVQTRYKGQTVPCTTYLVQQGYFDIFFPTDFALLRDLYNVLHGNEAGAPTMEISSQRDFLERWAEIDKTRLQNGDNPLLEHYANASFAWTV